ncbi:hypothetical protein Efla_004233 [Eimeria flavescens]
MTTSVSGDSQYAGGAAGSRSTSPAFMRLLSQHSQRSASYSSRSPSVASQVSSRRRVASPKVAARAWLGEEAAAAPSKAASTSTADSNRGPLRSRVHAEEEAGKYAVLNRSRGRPGRSKSREDRRDGRGRSGSRHSPTGHKKRRGSKEGPGSHRKKDRTILTPSEGPGRQLSRSPSRNPRQLVMSPRHFPPPTFEKILLGIEDADFVVEGEDRDVFGSESRRPRPRKLPAREEEHLAVCIQTDKPFIEGAPRVLRFLLFSVRSLTTDSASSRASLDVPLERQKDRQHDAMIPEHYLYIPPLRAIAAREGRRPVPGLQQASDDEGQISVRGERRHIATLFSLEAAESPAQKSRLEKQLKATSPFRLADMREGGIPVEPVEGLEGPPGKSKRRQRSEVLEALVREHEWELQAPGATGGAEEAQVSPSCSLGEEPEEQHSYSQVGDDVLETIALGTEVQWDPYIKKTRPSPASKAASTEEERKPARLSEASQKATQGGASSRKKAEAAKDELADVPKAFDAVWGHCEEKEQQTQLAETGRASYSEDEADRQQAVKKMDRLGGFLEAPSDFMEKIQDPADAVYADACFDPGNVDSGSDRASSVASNSASERQVSGGVALLRLGDPAEWEVRYSTADGFFSSTDPSPANSEKKAATAPGLHQEMLTEEEAAEEEEEEEDTSSCQQIGECLPEEPLSAASCSREASGCHTRMSSYVSRVSSLEPPDMAPSSAGLSLAAGCGAAALKLKSEPRLGAALDMGFVSFLSVKTEDGKPKAALPQDSATPVLLSFDVQAPRKRQRMSADGGAAAEADAQREAASDSAVISSSKAPQAGAVSSVAGGPETRAHRDSTHENGVQQEEALPHACEANNSEAIAEVTHEPDEHSRSLRAEFERSLSLSRFQPVTAADCDAWAEGETATLPDGEEQPASGQQTDRRGSDSLCDIDLSEPLRLGEKEAPSVRSPLPPPGRSVKIFHLISWATGGCAYGPSVHAVVLGAMLLSLWILLAVLYLFDEGRGLGFFVVCAVALSFLLSLCWGIIHLTSTFFRWRALQYALDSDMRDLLFSSLKRLRAAPDARDPSVEGLGERGRRLRLACDSFVDLITQKSPRLEVSEAVFKRFVLAHCFLGLFGAGLIAVLECSIESEGDALLAQLRLGDAIATGAAALYSALVLAVSYWLASGPSPGGVQRAIERHAAFQYLWSLTFADFLVDNKAVTARSAEDIWVQQKEGVQLESSPYLESLRNSLSKQDRSLSAIRVHGIPSALRSSYMTARIVWQLPAGVSSKSLKTPREGQRALLTLAAGPRLQGRPAKPLYLNLSWCESGFVPEEVQIPVELEALAWETVGTGRTPSCRESFALGRRKSHVALTQTPLDVLLQLLNLLKSDAKRSFMKSQTRQYLLKPVSFSSVSCEFPIILRVPLAAIPSTSCLAWKPQRRRQTSRVAAFPVYAKQQFNFRRPGGDPPSPAAAVNGDPVGNGGTDASAGGAAEARVGPWVVESLSRPNARGVASAEQASFPGSSDAAVSAANGAAKAAGADNGGQGSESFAFLTLLFASEEQREEFNGCLEQLLCV